MSREVEASLTRARGHLRNATLEGLEAGKALLEAALLAGGLDPAQTDSTLGGLRVLLDESIASVRERGRLLFPRALGDPLRQALDAEIARWQTRSRTDEDARAVLRAFLALRELLWELGLREDEPAPAARPSADKAGEPRKENPSRRSSPRPRQRVQRFDVQD